MDPGHRMSVHVRVCDVDQHALFLAAGSVYLPSGAPESGYSLGLEPDAADRYRSDGLPPLWSCDSDLGSVGLHGYLKSGGG